MVTDAKLKNWYRRKNRIMSLVLLCQSKWSHIVSGMQKQASNDPGSGWSLSSCEFAINVIIPTIMAQRWFVGRALTSRRPLQCIMWRRCWNVFMGSRFVNKSSSSLFAYCCLDDMSPALLGSRLSACLRSPVTTAASFCHDSCVAHLPVRLSPAAAPKSRNTWWHHFGVAIKLPKTHLSAELPQVPLRFSNWSLSLRDFFSYYVLNFDFNFFNLIAARLFLPVPHITQRW